MEFDWEFRFITRGPDFRIGSPLGAYESEKRSFRWVVKYEDRGVGGATPFVAQKKHEALIFQSSEF